VLHRRFFNPVFPETNAENPSYGQSKSESSLEPSNGNDENGDFDFPELSFGVIVFLMIVVVVIGVLSTWVYFKFFHVKKESEEEDVL